MLSSFESSFLKILNIYGSRVCPRNEHISIKIGESTPTGGGGGTRIIYCIRGSSVRAQPKRGGGVLGTATAHKNGGLRYWYSAKNGDLIGADTTRKRGGGGVCASCGLQAGYRLSSLFIYYLYTFNRWGCVLADLKGGGGVFGAGTTRKRGSYVRA